MCVNNNVVPFSVGLLYNSDLRYFLIHGIEILSPRQTLNRDFTVDGRVTLKLILKKK
jgi:hypothetical protein